MRHGEIWVRISSRHRPPLVFSPQAAMHVPQPYQIRHRLSLCVCMLSSGESMVFGLVWIHLVPMLNRSQQASLLVLLASSTWTHALGALVAQEYLKSILADIAACS